MPHNIKIKPEFGKPSKLLSCPARLFWMRELDEGRSLNLKLNQWSNLISVSYEIQYVKVQPTATVPKTPRKRATKIAEFRFNKIFLSQRTSFGIGKS
jgi:hypothetical protein